MTLEKFDTLNAKVYAVAMTTGETGRTVQDLEVSDVELGSRLEFLRRISGKSKREIASEINCDESLVGKMERGERELKIRHWPPLAKALSLGLDTFALMMFFDISHEQANTISQYIARCNPRNRRR